MSDQDESGIDTTVLVTGVAGFVGGHTALTLAARGATVIGVDNLSPIAEKSLQRDRLARLGGYANFRFHQSDINDLATLRTLPGMDQVSVVIHLAAQAGVRYSIENPFIYGQANLMGHLSILELCRHHPRQPRLVYASSSSVYGANAKTPFSETDPVDHPVSLYAATKRANEIMSESYAALYPMEQIGLRFFTVYGPWGRPDMAYWSFTRSILDGKPIAVFNNGEMRRDFTYIDDVVDGILAVALQTPRNGEAARHRIYNLGNNQPEDLMHMIRLIEKAAGRKAILDMKPMQQGDVRVTYADMEKLASDYGFRPTTPLETGIGRFVEWFSQRYGYR